MKTSESVGPDESLKIAMFTVGVARNNVLHILINFHKLFNEVRFKGLITVDKEDRAS